MHVRSHLQERLAHEAGSICENNALINNKLKLLKQFVLISRHAYITSRQSVHCYVCRVAQNHNSAPFLLPESDT